ncbi:LOW QUALITY PROTEIN: hypothetical protein MC885_007601 [Smutsia gigantea]|nr:LOW QUALITY PROTEIN: hypothetical protein MC885_007601 [Smutsia gigantea]
MELRDEILPRAQNIQSRLDRQTIETEEVSKTLKATLQALLEGVTLEDGDAFDSFQTSPSTESLKSTSSDPGARQASRRRGQQQETETFYITGAPGCGDRPGHREGPELGLKLEALLGDSQKLQEYLSGRSILAKLQAKHEKLQEAIQREPALCHFHSRTQYTQRKFQKSCHPRPSSQYNQKLFGGDMEKFIQPWATSVAQLPVTPVSSIPDHWTTVPSSSSGQPVPLVVESCVRFINLNGLQHEGIFRVSGAQPRVSEIRDAFERGGNRHSGGGGVGELARAGVIGPFVPASSVSPPGEDPLVEGCTVHDLDSVAGVLKLYFRSLEPPLFTPDLFRELLASAELEAVAERVEHVSRLLARLPRSVLVVLRYLFTFLNQ